MVIQGPNTSQDSSLTRWEPGQDNDGSHLSMSQVILCCRHGVSKTRIFGSSEKSSKSMLGKPQRLPRLPEAHRLQFEPAWRLNTTMVDRIFDVSDRFCHVDMVSPKTWFSGRLVVSQVPEFSQASTEHRLNLLYESHPAETQVDGLPRAASWNCSRSSYSFGVSFQLVCTTFYGESDCTNERFWKICFRQVLVSTRSSWRDDFSGWHWNSRLFVVFWQSFSGLMALFDRSRLRGNHLEYPQIQVFTDFHDFWGFQMPWWHYFSWWHANSRLVG